MNGAEKVFRISFRTGSEHHPGDTPTFLFQAQQFGFTPVDPSANENEDTLFFREEYNPNSGSAARNSFRGPYTRDEALDIVIEELLRMT